MDTLFLEILGEWSYQDSRGNSSDDMNHTIEDWVGYIESYLERCKKSCNDEYQQRLALIKVAALSLRAVKVMDSK